ncbi:FecR family protein [Flavitalea flava]
MDTQQRLPILFAKYLQRSCTPEEVEELIALLQKAEAEEGLNGPMLALWQQAKEDKREFPVDWEKMYAAVSQTEDDLHSLHRKRNNRQRIIGLSFTWSRVAAVFAVIVLVAAAYWGLSRKGRSGQQPDPGIAAAGKPSPLNKKQIIHLPDGSTVILNADSKLDYPAVFTGKTREVYLSGEAFFDIVHSPRKPFLVHTGKVTTKVLGTAFDIKAYPADEAIEVTVTQGRVQVLKEDTELGLLSDNQQLRFSKQSGDLRLKQMDDIRPVIAWKPEEIRLDDISMLEAATRIGERFNIQVEFINPAIKECRITATFYSDDMLNEIMTVICGVTQSNFTILDNKIVIDGKGCN